MKKRMFKPKRCVRCSKTYLPSSGVQKYCTTCSAIVTQEKKHYYNTHKRKINNKIKEYINRVEEANKNIQLKELKPLKPNKEKDVMKRIEIIMIIWLFANILTNIALTLIYVITLK